MWFEPESPLPSGYGTVLMCIDHYGHLLIQFFFKLNFIIIFIDKFKTMMTIFVINILLIISLNTAVQHYSARVYIFKKKRSSTSVVTTK